MIKLVFWGTLVISSIFSTFAAANTVVLQYNMKYGKPGQKCCHQAQHNQQELVAAILSDNNVDLACLIESQNASDDKSCFPWSIHGYNVQCQTCPGSGFAEAITLVYSDRYTYKETWRPGGNAGCCTTGQNGRGFMAISLTDKTGQDFIFIGIHAPQNVDTVALSSQISAAVSGLKGTNLPIILSGDFNYNHGNDWQDSSNALVGTFPIEYGTWSNISDLPQCGTNDSNYQSSQTFDNVFTNQPNVSLTGIIPLQYCYQSNLFSYDGAGKPYSSTGTMPPTPTNGVYSKLTQSSLGNTAQSEEHIPLLVTITGGM